MKTKDWKLLASALALIFIAMLPSTPMLLTLVLGGSAGAMLSYIGN